MSVWKKISGALLGCVLACGVALAMGTWVFPDEKDLIISLGAFRLSVAGMGAGMSLLVMLGFADGWIVCRKKEGPGEAGFGRLWNGLGLGLLPGIALWKDFEQGTALGRGTEAAQGIPQISWIMENGRWMPGRLEMVLALALFAAEVLWLFLRRERLPENGDLLGVSLALWVSARMVTEPFRAEQIALLGQERLVGWLAAAVLALVLLRWVLRIFRQRKNTGYALVCVPVFVAAIAGIVLIQNEVLRIGIPAADLAMQVILALLALKAVLCAGRVSR